MKRDFSQLDRDPFDLLVVGGGIYGAWIAYDAALRGLSVALVEQNDWAAGTSSASSKLIHGGLRYLEHGWFGLVRKSLGERRRLLDLAPHRVWPLRFLVPVRRDDRVGRFRLACGLWLYDWLAGAGRRIRRHERFSRQRILERCPFMDPEGVAGGFAYTDCATDDARYTVEIVAGATAAGAVAVNHARVDNLCREGGRVVGASVVDALDGATIEVRAATLVVAAGPWAAGLVAPVAPPPPVRLTRGIHLVMPPLAIDEAVLLTARSDGRVFFLIPWYGATLLGTTDTDFAGAPETAAVEDADVDYLLAEANRFLGRESWTKKDIRGRFAGVRTLRMEPGKSPSEVSREWQLEEPADRLLLPVGGKLTSARAEAAATVDRVVELVGQRFDVSETAARPFPWRPVGDFDAWLARTVAAGRELGLDDAAATTVARRYGAMVAELHDAIRADGGLAKRITPALPFVWAEVGHVIEHEMAVSLEDIVRRRIPLVILDVLPDAALERIAAIAGERLGWSAEQRRGQLAGLDRRAEIA